MSVSQRRGAALRVARTVFVLSSMAFVGSMVVTAFTLYSSPRQPDEIHSHRHFTSGHSARYLTDPKHVLVEVATPIFWGAMVLMVAAGVIVRKLGPPPGETSAH